MKTRPSEPAIAYLVDLASESVAPVEVVGGTGAFRTYLRPIAGLVCERQCAANALAPTRADGLRLLAERMELAARSRVELAEAAVASAKQDQARAGVEVARLRAEADGEHVKSAA